MRSIDSGYTWTAFPSPGTSWITTLEFADSATGYGVGEFGAIIKYSIDSATSSSDYIITAESFALYQNYPNPFNPETKIIYSVQEPAYVELFVYNSLGEKIAEPVNEYKSTGTYDVTFSGEGLPSGIYYYRLKVNNHSQIRKMLLLK
jgi:hypothetical protein